MPARLPAPAVAVALAAVLLALPACGKKDDAPAGPGINFPPDPRLRVKSSNNLKQIAIAIHSFHDANAYFPGGVVGPDRKSVGLSWRVQILPYVEEGMLYSEFKMNEPWDGPHNRTLVARMPKVYLPPEVDDYGGHTFYRSFAGERAFIPTLPKNFQGFPGTPARGRRITEITDGTSNTWMVAEALEPVIWTKPDELAFDPDGPLPLLGGIFRDGFNVAFADGSVRYFKKDELAPEQLRALITPNGGEVVVLP